MTGGCSPAVCASEVQQSLQCVAGMKDAVKHGDSHSMKHGMNHGMGNFIVSLPCCLHLALYTVITPLVPCCCIVEALMRVHVHVLLRQHGCCHGL